MKDLTQAERAELKVLTRKIRTQKATRRQFLRAFDLTHRDHAQVKRDAQSLHAMQAAAESLSVPSPIRYEE